MRPHLLLMEPAADLADAGSADVDCFRSSDGMSDSLLLGLYRRPLRFGGALSSNCTDLSLPSSLGVFGAALCCSIAEPLDCCTGSATSQVSLPHKQYALPFELSSIAVQATLL